MNILITGATGFIGSHITESIVKEGHNVYAICRNISNYEKCIHFRDRVIWLNQDKKNWELELKDVEINQFIHTGWTGVTAAERNDWPLQLANFAFSKSMIDLAIHLKTKKIICLGSQSEYGLYSQKVTEDHVPAPIDAYGAVKLLTLYYLQNVAKKNDLVWYWLRIFSIIGERENSSWLLSQAMQKLLFGEEIELTPCEQYYDYLYINDFITALTRIMNCESDISAIYNICSGRPVKIQHLLLLVAEKLNIGISALKFGAIPYRENQNMYMVGSPAKYDAAFGKQKISDLEEIVAKIASSFVASIQLPCTVGVKGKAVLSDATKRFL
jgi:nucleoside-diphosphate-sugar epimerase